MGRTARYWEPFDTDETLTVRRHLEHLRLRNLRPVYINARLSILARTRRFADVPLLEATSEQLGGWLGSRKITPAARAVDLSHLKAFYKWALIEELVVKDPTLKLIRPKVGRRLPRPMPDDDVRRAFAQAPPDVLAVLSLAAYAGLRACEIAGLDRADILDKGTPPVIVVRDGKGGKQRVIPAAPNLLHALQMMGMPDDGPLFSGWDGSDRVSRSRICQKANNYLHGLEITHTLHTLRHWFGTNMYAETRDIRLTQELMGHSSPTTTAGYAQWNPAIGAAAVGRLTVG